MVVPTNHPSNLINRKTHVKKHKESKIQLFLASKYVNFLFIPVCEKGNILKPLCCDCDKIANLPAMFYLHTKAPPQP